VPADRRLRRHERRPHANQPPAQRAAHARWLLRAGRPLEAARVSYPDPALPAADRDLLRPVHEDALKAAHQEHRRGPFLGLATCSREALFVLDDGGAVRSVDLLSGAQTREADLGFRDLWERIDASPAGDLLLVHYHLESALEEAAFAGGDPAFFLDPEAPTREARLYTWPAAELRARWGGRADVGWTRRLVRMSHEVCYGDEDPELVEHCYCLETLGRVEPTTAG